jgi:serine protease Do
VKEQLRLGKAKEQDIRRTKVVAIRPTSDEEVDMQGKKIKTHRYFLFCVAVFFTFGLIHCNAQDTQPPAGQKRAEMPEDKTSPPASAVSLSTAIARVARDTIPAVAHIEVTESEEVRNPLLPFENDPFFHYFFNMPRKMPRKFKRELRGLGTGMIMDVQGHILTNNHVVGGATKINVLLADGTQYDASVVGTDPKTDLAVIQIKADETLPHVAFGDSDKIDVGDWVVAIGHPRGLDQTVTQGIISAKHRRGILNPSGYQDYLQTDAAINPGNSGGPLLNLEGKVIGVNSAIVSESGGFEGIGFAIPSNMALHIARQLIAHGKVERGWLGVNIRDITPALAKSKNLEGTKGVLVVGVSKGGPADAAGLQKDDVVTAYQGESIPDASTLRDKVADTSIGQEADLTILRNGKRMDLHVKIGNLEEAVKKMAAAAQERLGVVVRPVSDKEVQEYGLQKLQGVAIQSLEHNGPLARQGFEVNDIILAINRIPVPGVQEFVDIVEQLKSGQSAQITVLDHRSGQVGNIAVIVK